MTAETLAARPTESEVGALLSAAFHALGTHALSGHTTELERRLSEALGAILAGRDAGGAEPLTDAEWDEIRSETCGCLSDEGLRVTVEGIIVSRAAEVRRTAGEQIAQAIEEERDASSERLMEFEDGYSEGHANAARIAREVTR